MPIGYLLTSVVGGFLVFQELPHSWTVVGAVLIVGSGIYPLHREAVRVEPSPPRLPPRSRIPEITRVHDASFN